MRLLTVIAVIAFCAFPGMQAYAATTAPVSAVVLDDESGLPLADAHVLYIVRASKGTITGHGGGERHLALAESKTNANGEFFIPKQRINPYPFLLNTLYSYPELTFFKPGYSPKSINSEWSGGASIPELKDVLQWPQRTRPVRLKKPLNQRAYHMELLGLNSPFGYSEYQCAFKKFPRFILAIEYEAIRMKRDYGINTPRPLSQLLSREENPQTQSALLDECGSPRAFFEALGPLPELR